MISLTGLNWDHLQADVQRDVILTRGAYRALEQLLERTHCFLTRCVETTGPVHRKMLLIRDMRFFEGPR